MPCMEGGYRFGRGESPRENGPRLHERTFRGGRSRDLSLREGHTVLGAEETSSAGSRTPIQRLPGFE